MTTSQATLLGALVLVATALIVGLVLKKSRQSEWGFREVIKHPGYWVGVDKARQEADAAARAAKGWDQAKVEAATRHFILKVASSSKASRDANILLGLGDRTHPTIIELLEDKTLYGRLVKPTSEGFVPEAPFNRACQLLGDTPPRGVITAAAPFLDDSSEDIRKDAAWVIAKTGDDSIVPYMSKALADSDEYVRSYALMGLRGALERGGLSPRLAQQLFPEMQRLLETGNNAEEAAGILFRFDPEKARGFFLSTGVFSPDSPILHEALKTLADAKAPVPRKDLLFLIGVLESKELKNPDALGSALRLLGQQGLPEDREFLKARTSHPKAEVAGGAAAGLLCSHGLEGFEERIWKAEKNGGYGSLSEHQRHYSAVSACDAEINNGGLSQYFVNSAGDDWKDALAGFETMGSTQRLAILREAIALFGAAGPSENRTTRQEQLSKLCQKDDAIFDGLDKRYYASTEPVSVLVSRLVLAHPESFR